jgi:hypothetical protein
MPAASEVIFVATLGIVDEQIEATVVTPHALKQGRNLCIDRMVHADRDASAPARRHELCCLRDRRSWQIGLCQVPTYTATRDIDGGARLPQNTRNPAPGTPACPCDNGYLSSQ